jgi:excisionase family DNA binding protein
MATEQPIDVPNVSPSKTNTPGIHKKSLQTGRQRFVNSLEAAEFLGGLNPRTVTRWAREGYLPAYAIGEGKRRVWRFLEQDLEGWLLSRKTGLPSDPPTVPGTLDASHRCSDQRRFK